VHTFCKLCLRNNYYWFDQKKDEVFYRCLFYNCGKDEKFGEFCKIIPREILNYVIGRRVMDYME